MMSLSRPLLLTTIWGVLLVFRSCPSAVPQVSKPVVLPGTMTTGLATALTVSSNITTKTTGPGQTPTGVKLLRVDSSNVVTHDLGTMRDDGSNGDAVAGDQIYTLKLTLTETAPGELSLSVGASFQGLPKQIRSPVSTVPVVAANAAPVVSAGTDQIILPTAMASLSGTANDDGLPSGGSLTFLWSRVNGPGTVTFANAGALVTTASFSTAGNYQLKLSASDSELTGTDEVNITVNAANQPPTVSITNPAGSTPLTAPASITFAASASDSDGSVTKLEFFEGSTKLGEATTAPYSLIWNSVAAGNYSLTARATDDKNATTTSNAVNIIVKTASVLPPDPVSVAPPLDLSVATDIKTSTEFLYTGTNPIQTGVTPGRIEVRRVGILRGKVLDRANTALPGVKISVFDHPEFGQTLSRVDGAFDLAVNGGGPITVRYEKADYLPAQRQVSAPWRDYVNLDDVVLIPRDAQVTTINLGATATTMQVARSSIQTDADGTRRATVLFPPETTAGLVQPDGATLPTNTLNVHLTEYTVGPKGPQAMPAELPPASAYTYAVDLGADEAVAKVNGHDVVFNQPVFFYVENFLNLPVGGIAPAGFYDRDKTAWIPSANGRVIRILSVGSGLANLDVDGSGQQASTTALATLGVTDAERQQLVTLYVPGQSLWRVPISHFSSMDINWPYRPDCDPAVQSCEPSQPPPQGDQPDDDPCEQGGSIIECQNQILGEVLPVSGTPFTLNYRSDRTPGRKAAYTLSIPLSGATVPPTLKRIDLVVDVAGQRLTQSFPGAANQRTTFTWDGRDAYGRSVQGQRPVSVRIGYVYRAVYLRPGEGSSRAFAVLSASGLALSADYARQQITFWQEWRGSIGPWDARAEGLGGWSFGVHHAYDPAGNVLYLGDGSRRSARSLSDVLTTVAGDGNFCSGGGPCGDGGPATKAQLTVAEIIAVGPDGSFYIPDRDYSRIRRVAPNGIITTIAGNRSLGFGFSGDGGQATAARLGSPEGVAVGPDGSLYIADTGNNRIRRVGLHGIISTVAGNGSTGNGTSSSPPGDGGPAIQAQVSQPKWITVGPDGSLYISDPGYYRIRKVDPGRVITTLAGTGQRCVSGAPCGDGGPASQATFNSLRGIALGPDGSLYIADTDACRIRRIGPDGKISTVAGRITSLDPRGFAGDGGPASDALFNVPKTVAVGPDGSLYIADENNNRVRRVGPDGVITTVAGTGTAFAGTIQTGFVFYGGDGGPATQSQLQPSHALLGPDGALYIWGSNMRRVRRVAPLVPGTIAGDLVIAAGDGSEVYIFSHTGQHLQTLHALTGAVIYRFAYDNKGHLTKVTDGDNNVTTVERDALGEPTAIISPFGQRTTLAVDANGYLEKVANPAAESFLLETTPDGLLTRFTDPKGNGSQMTYNPLGQLTRDTDAATGFTSLARTETDQSFTASLSTALGRAASYQVERLATGAQRRVNRFPDNTNTELLIGTDGGRKSTVSDGTITNLLEGPDPRFSMQAPLLTRLSVTTGGLTSTLTTVRTANLTNPDNPMSLTRLTDTVTLNGRTFTSVYDAATRTATRTSAAGRQSNTVIDPLGRVLKSQVNGRLAYNLAYDPRGRLSRITRGTGVDERAGTLSYNTDGHLETLTDPLGRTFRLTYDTAGRVTQQTLPDGRAIVYGYDVNGNLTSLTPPGRPAHLFSYTKVGLQGEYTPPAVGAGGNSTRYAYNLDKQLTRITRPDGQILDFGYDAAGRPKLLTLPAGQMSYAYDPVTGNVNGVTTPDGGTLSYTYNGALLTRTAWAGTVAGAVSRSFDNDFRVTSLSINGTDAITFQYDADGLLTRAGDLTLSRNAQNGSLTATTLGNVTDSIGYDGFGEVTAYTANYSGSEIFKNLFSYDKLGRITTKTESVAGINATFEYGYDLAGRLTAVKKNGTLTATYTYDGNGNRLMAPNLSTAASYDDQDRLTRYGGTTYSYTANGELKTKTAGALVTSYDYDVLGNLKHVTLPDGTTIDYVVDGQNRRIGKKVNGVLTQGFLYQDGLKPVAELDGANLVVSRFVYATGVNVPVYMIKGGVTYRIITDQLGSPRLVVDIATNTVAQRIDYDEFGNVMQDNSPGFQPFGFAGGVYEPATKLVRFGARDYDAEIGRWTAKDPIGFAGSNANLYEYVLSDPVNFTDSTGNATTTIHLKMFTMIFMDGNIIGAGEYWLLATGASQLPRWLVVMQQAFNVGNQVAGKCEDVARAIAEGLRHLGQNPQIINITSTGGRFLNWQGKSMVSDNNFHQAVLNGGRVIDAYTGL